MRLRHADREVSEAEPLVGRDLRARLVGVVDAVGAVHALSDRLDLLLDRGLERIEEAEGPSLVAGAADGGGQRAAPLPAFREDLAHLRREGARGEGALYDQRVLAVGVGREAVDRDDRWDAVGRDVLELLLEVADARLDRAEVLAVEGGV